MNNKSFLIGAAAGALLLLPTQLPAGGAPLNFVADAAAGQSIDFVLKLPLRNSAELDQLIHVQSSADSPLYHHFLTPAQFRASFGPTAATFARAEAALRANGFAITRFDSQMLHVRGNAATINRAFRTQIGVVRESASRVRYAARAPLFLPQSLTALGATVADLAPTIRPHPMFAPAAGPLNRKSKVGPYYFDDLKQAYEYPSYGVANGSGVTVATVGESDYSTSDATKYFASEGLGKGGLAPAPTLKRVLLAGAAPFDATTGISDEADLDVQQVGGSAPGATVVGVAASGNPEFLDAYAYLNESNFADIVSTSYGECELYYTAPYFGVDETGILQAYHDLFRQGNAQGITFVFSSGDNSGTQCFPPGYFAPKTGKTFATLDHGAGIWVDDPDATGVGGTNLITSYTKGSLKSTYVSENEIADRVASAFDIDGTGNYIKGALWGSSGGPSSLFAKPDFQKLVPTGYNTRTVPDVSMHMGGCPFYGKNVKEACDLVNRDSADYAVVGGQLVGLIGTSASSPEFAGLLAVKESVIKSRLGNANEDIYRLAAANAKGHYFHQGIYGYNGIVHVAQGQLGYNPIVGVGTPIARNFVGLPDAELAGDPQTSTNP